MQEYMVMLVVAIIAVAIMVLGLAITQIRKGRPLQSDVGDNDDMKRLGLKCTSQQFRQEEAELRGEKSDNIVGGCGSTCGSCGDC